MCYKILLKSSQFCSSERLWSPKITCTPPWILQLLKKPLGKLADVDDIDTVEAMRFELSVNGVADGVLETVEICTEEHWTLCRIHFPAEVPMAWRCSVRCFARCYVRRQTLCGSRVHSHLKARLLLKTGRNDWCTLERDSLLWIWSSSCLPACSRQVGCFHTTRCLLWWIWLLVFERTLGRRDSTWTRTIWDWQTHHCLLQCCKALFLVQLRACWFHHQDGFL